MKNIRETSLLSYEALKDELGERYTLCIEGLKELKAATANELAMYLFENGKAPVFNRHFVHPRLTELVEMKIVKEVGKKLDKISNRKCLVYALN